MIRLADVGGMTPLSVASEYGHSAVVELLLRADASVDLPDVRGVTPLFGASREGYDRPLRRCGKAAYGFWCLNSSCL